MQTGEAADDAAHKASGMLELLQNTPCATPLIHTHLLQLGCRWSLRQHKQLCLDVGKKDELTISRKAKRSVSRHGTIALSEEGGGAWLMTRAGFSHLLVVQDARFFSQPVSLQ
tara:strand:- start:171 stop:509 length:339 start_codon:yes stop_codon:yes gene_type:complete